MLHPGRRSMSMRQLFSVPLRSKGELMLFSRRGSPSMRQRLCSHQRWHSNPHL